MDWSLRLLNNWIKSLKHQVEDIYMRNYFSLAKYLDISIVQGKRLHFVLAGFAHLFITRFALICRLASVSEKVVQRVRAGFTNK